MAKSYEKILNDKLIQKLIEKVINKGEKTLSNHESRLQTR